ncbi:hypothetical protein QQM79_12530 [Marinobacteraceae bacterium S3BR75-40.1]
MLRDEKRIYRFIIISGLITAIPWVMWAIYGTTQWLTNGNLGFSLVQGAFIALFASLAIALLLWLMPQWRKRWRTHRSRH